MLSSITPLILTYNEAPNVARSLERLGGASRIIVVDSLSTDRAMEILRKAPRVEVFQRPFDTHSNQWNFGLDQVTTEWTLSLDADYLVSEALVDEVSSLTPADDVDAFIAPFKFKVLGRELRASLYPAKPVLFRAKSCRYYQDGHTQRLLTHGRVQRLKASIIHDDRKPLSEWLAAQQRYASLDAEKIARSSIKDLSWPDRLRRMAWPAPLAVFIQTLLFKRLILDGWPGWYYVFQRTVAEVVLALRLMELAANRKAGGGR